jgi:hypothetical protein
MGRPDTPDIAQPLDIASSARWHTRCSTRLAMDMLDAELAKAEFEETWLEVRYHEGEATLAEVEQAMARVNELRALVERLAAVRAAEGGMLAWWTSRSAVAASH